MSGGGVRAVLEAERDRLRRGRPDRPEVERLPDFVDQAMAIVEREASMGRREEHDGRLRMVERALVRLERGGYGVCVSCEEEIAEKRLAAVPWAETCIGCASRGEARAQRELREKADTVARLLDPDGYARC